MKETWDKTMQERTDQCARAEDLVAYLYGEATAKEAIDFENHMQRCASCRAETAAFGSVREAIGDWRQQSLGTLPSHAFEANLATGFASTREASRQRRSALTALREFFSLSPVWMRAATAAIALVFCALAIIAVVHFVEQPNVVVIESPGAPDNIRKSDTPAVAETGKESNAPKVEGKDQPAPQKVNVADNNKRQAFGQRQRGAINSPQLAKQRKQVLPRNVVKPSEELASANDYLPFTAPSNEDKLPSLVDLVEEPN